MSYDISLPNLTQFSSFLRNYDDVIAFYFPLGIIGVWRWGTWFSKKIIALFYKPKRNIYTSSVAIITPVYNEDPLVFLEALVSWVKNKPQEIIAVIDYTDTKCITVFKKFAKKHASARLVITRIPGKRSALVTGIRRAKGSIVALVDSDTIWAKDTLRYALCPFADPKVGGVGTRQNVLNPKTLAQRIFNIQLNTRYIDEMPFLATSSDALTCLSGRSAFYRKSVLLPVLDKIVNEMFRGKKVISGEDKRITYLVEQAGWKITYQSNARVFTHGVEGFTTFFNQRLRWSRNSWRADLRALKEGWVFRHPALAFHLIDKTVQPFTSMLSPLYFFFALLSGFWIGALIILIWWHVSRCIKIFPHLRQNPKDIFILPFYIVSNFTFGITKIYALFTMNSQGWITRWDVKRLSQLTFLQKAPAYVVTIAVFLIVGSIVAYHNQYVFTPQALSLTSKQNLSLVRVKQLSLASPNVLGVKTASDLKAKQTVAIYEIKEGDTLSSIANQFDTSLQNLLQANEAILPNWNMVQIGMLISIPFAETLPTSHSEYNYLKKYYPFLTLRYDENSNTVIINGRGNSVTLAIIRDAIGEKYIKESRPKEWIINANILAQNGVTFHIDQNEATLVKLESNSKKFVKIIVENAVLDIDGVKITSWDDSAQDVDRVLTDGRSYILAKYTSLIRINDAELAYLGYPPPTSATDASYGVSLKVPEKSKEKYFITGQVIQSKFHNNYTGMYVSTAGGIRMSNNSFYNNITHGLHIDGGTHDFVIENNTMHDNGEYGIILSDGSTKNLLQNNAVYKNEEGIVLSDTSQNTLMRNTIFSNTLGLRLSKSPSNKISYNNIQDNSQYGMYIYEDSASNFISNNTLIKNSIALSIQSNSNTVYKNNIQKNRTGIYLSKNASGNQLIANQIAQNRLYAVFTKTTAGAKNFLSSN